MERLERRQLTVLFCDLVGSTDLAAAMELEELHEVMLDFQRFCARSIEAARGYVARFAGDGMLAYFGYPIALEDAPQRAIHAALHLKTAGQYLPNAAGRPLQTRVGIATGIVVVGELLGNGAAQERAITGLTPNLAARLQSIATPGAIVISNTTKRLAEGTFNFHPLGPLELKGFPTPETAWEVCGQSQIVRRFDARRGMGVPPLISRESELEAILSSSREARGGQTRAVGIIGDPGLGKSRLFEEARQRIGGEAAVVWLDGGGASIFDNTPFHVAAQFLEPLSAAVSTAGYPTAETDRARVRDLIAGTLHCSSAPAGTVDNATERRRELLQLLVRWIGVSARHTPTVLGIEDLHWVDPSTLEVLDRLITDPAEYPLLLLYTSRTPAPDRWPTSARHRILGLHALAETASAALALHVAGRRLPESQIGAIVSQANGIPLYIEELTRLITTREGTAAATEIPTTLSDLLAAQLERLGPVKRSAQIAAVLGQEFSAELFGAMAEPDAFDASQALRDLSANSIVVPLRTESPARYAFRHALIANAAYGALLKRQRRELHARAASLILERYPGLAETQPQILARHWTGAGNTPKAVAAWDRAGDIAYDRRAFREAERSYREALAALDGDAALSDHDQLAMSLNAKLARVLQITQGYSADEAARLSHRVAELAVKIGDAETLSRQKSAKWRSVFTAGDYAAADRIMEDVMDSTRAHGNALWRQTLYLRVGIQQGFYTGDLARGERDFLAWSAIQDGSHRGAGDDVLSMGIAALIAFMTGRPQVADQRMAAAHEIGQRRGNPYDRAMALHVQSCLDHFARDAEQQAQSAERLTAVAAESGFEYAGLLALGWTAVANTNAGRAQLAIGQALESIAGFARLGARISVVFWLHVLGRAYTAAGDPAKALEAYADAMAFNRQERAFRLEAYLGRAELLAAAGRHAEAARDLRNCARLAGAMGATTYRQRSLVELARLSSETTLQSV